MKQALVIGIAGGTGSGKTTLAVRLKKAFENDVTLICQVNITNPLTIYPLKNAKS